MKTLVERLETPVREETDVLVVGGGIAGVAAALAARARRRAGAPDGKAGAAGWIGHQWTDQLV